MMKIRYALCALTVSIAALAVACGAVEQAQFEEPSSRAAQQTDIEPTAQYSAPSAPAVTKTAQLGGGIGRAAVPKAHHFPVRRCMNMGNALEADFEGEWGYTIRAKDFKTIARAGFDTVRIPVRWDLKTETTPPYRIDSAHMKRVIEVVRQAQAAGLGVVLDVHHYRALMAKARGAEAERFLAIWTQISIAFAGAPNTVYFELLNEPTDASMADLNRLYARALKVIRRHNPTRAVIMGGNRWNGLETLGQVQFPRDPYLVATYHDYGPHEFTHQGASWEDNPPPLGRKWGSPADKAEMNGVIAQAHAFKMRTGLPVFVGEFGVIDEVPTGERMQWTAQRRRAMERAGLSWCAWDFAGAFKTYDTSVERWIGGANEALTGR